VCAFSLQICFSPKRKWLAACAASRFDIQGTNAVNLPAPAATVEASASVETTTAMEAAHGPAMETASAVEATNRASAKATARSTAEPSPAANATYRAAAETLRRKATVHRTCTNAAAAEGLGVKATAAPAGPVAIAVTVVSAVKAITRPKAEAAEPWAGADEDAADEPVRAVETVRRAGIGVIRVVAVGTDRRGADVTRTHANTNRDLRFRRRSREEHKGAQQSQIFEITHFRYPSSDPNIQLKPIGSVLSGASDL
jgi:hypothetical protein